MVNQSHWPPPPKPTAYPKFLQEPIEPRLTQRQTTSTHIKSTRPHNVLHPVPARHRRAPPIALLTTIFIIAALLLGRTAALNARRRRRRSRKAHAHFKIHLPRGNSAQWAQLHKGRARPRRTEGRGLPGVAVVMPGRHEEGRCRRRQPRRRVLYVPHQPNTKDKKRKAKHLWLT